MSSQVDALRTATSQRRSMMIAIPRWDAVNAAAAAADISLDLL